MYFSLHNKSRPDKVKHKTHLNFESSHFLVTENTQDPIKRPWIGARDSSGNGPLRDVVATIVTSFSSLTLSASPKKKKQVPVARLMSDWLPYFALRCFVVEMEERGGYDEGCWFCCSAAADRFSLPIISRDDLRGVTPASLCFWIILKKCLTFSCSNLLFATRK